MNGRVKRVFANLVEEVDAILLINDAEPNIDQSFFYVTGLESGLFEGCFVILWPDGGLDLFSSKLEETSARSVLDNVRVFNKGADREQMLKDSLRGVKRLGINGAAITLRNFREIKKAVPGIEEVDVWKAIEKARLVKDSNEVERIRKACKIVSVVAEEIPHFLTEGITEYEAAAEIAYRMQKKGATSPSFDPNASFGANSAEPHHVPTDKKLSRGECALFDFGAKYRRYCSDITRTFFFGKPHPDLEEMYSIVLEAQDAAIRMMRAGARAKDIDACARDIIDATRFKGRFIHSIGHAIGLSVHDGGRIAAEDGFVLEENMVLTVEPGIYVPGIGGIRIEDDVLVTASGCELLTTAPKELMVI
ncbi:MAG: Xaa-Pro peptidase family protein [Methanomassiliicoccales archaeon]|jgi:Xaa-Pro dipeptidase|nr:Xaa-Pro peptidase family protein [Methanomassiliicoccales archaeon]